MKDEIQDFWPDTLADCREEMEAMTADIDNMYQQIQLYRAGELAFRGSEWFGRLVGALGHKKNERARLKAHMVFLQKEDQAERRRVAAENSALQLAIQRQALLSREARQKAHIEYAAAEREATIKTLRAYIAELGGDHLERATARCAEMQSRMREQNTAGRGVAAS